MKPFEKQDGILQKVIGSRGDRDIMVIPATELYSRYTIERVEH